MHFRHYIHDFVTRLENRRLYDRGDMIGLNTEYSCMVSLIYKSHVALFWFDTA